MFLSNVAGPKVPLVYQGSECRQMATLIPGASQVACTMSVISIGDTVRIGIMADEKICDHPEEILALFEETRASVLTRT